MSLSQLSAILPLPQHELNQVLAHATTLSPEEAASHLTGLLGDSPQAVEFISAFNAQRASRPRGAKKDDDYRTAPRISVTGGTQMTGGPSAALADLDAAIRALEASAKATTPAGDAAARRCDCVATRHPLQTAAPNCLSCGKVICVKQGLGPCTFCGTRLLSEAEVRDLVRELREERGREKQALNRDAQRRADAARAAPTYSRPRTGPGVPLGPTPAEEARAAAVAHRDRLLGFQSENAQRTTIRDEASDFDVGLAVWGQTGLWGSKEERARELARQQAVLREMEWSQKPEWERRVASIDVVGGKIVKRVEREEREEVGGKIVKRVERVEREEREEAVDGGAARSNNPLAGGLIRPVYKAGGVIRPVYKAGGVDRPRGTGWSRVDLDEETVT